MLEQVLRHLRNWFVRGFYAGTYVIEGGEIITISGVSPALLDGQYFRIVGSALNDGIYQHPAEGLTDETFEGEIWALAVPKALLSLVDEIAAWQEKNGSGQAVGPYTSESFGGYTYTKAVDAKTGGAVTWESAYRNRLNVWRKA